MKWEKVGNSQYEWSSFMMPIYPKIDDRRNGVQIKFARNHKVAVIKLKKENTTEQKTGWLIKGSRFGKDHVDKIKKGHRSAWVDVIKDKVTDAGLAVSDEGMQAIAIAYLRQLTAEQREEIMRVAITGQTDFQQTLLTVKFKHEGV
jgi:hypothetical protein